MKEDMTLEEVIELIKGDLNLEGWRGETCMGCVPKNESPFPSTINVPIGTEKWECPNCGLVNVFTYRKIKPIHQYPDYGVLGSVIVKAYEELGMESNFDFEELKLEKEKT